MLFIKNDFSSIFDLLEENTGSPQIMQWNKLKEKDTICKNVIADLILYSKQIEHYIEEDYRLIPFALQRIRVFSSKGR